MPVSSFNMPDNKTFLPNTGIIQCERSVESLSKAAWRVPAPNNSFKLQPLNQFQFPTEGPDPRLVSAGQEHRSPQDPG